MVRQCAANGCEESDATLITHRFPRDTEMASKWKDALNITHLTLEQLQKGYVICTKHFAPSSYRNETSNCLNSTAIPNLKQNAGNERQYLKDRIKQPSIPARCFKLPPNVNASPEVHITRFVKRPGSEEGKPATKKQAITVVHSLDDTFEMVSGSTADSFVITKSMSEVAMRPLECQVVLRPSPRQLPIRNSQRVSSQVMQAQSMMNLHKPNPQRPKRIRAHRHSQTDDEPANEPQQKDNLSKDDKLVQLLYPECEGISKVKLIEMVKEKDQRIAVLEEKIKKMEAAF